MEEKKLNEITVKFLLQFLNQFVCVETPHDVFNNQIWYDYGYLVRVEDSWITLKRTDGTLKPILRHTIIGLHTAEPRPRRKR
jgi:hypothetical protein